MSRVISNDDYDSVKNAAIVLLLLYIPAYKGAVFVKHIYKVKKG